MIGLLALVAVGAGILGIVEMSGMMRDTDHLMAVQSDLMVPMETIDAHQGLAQAYVAQLAAAGSSASKAAWKQKMAENDKVIQDAIAAFGATEGATLPSWTTYISDRDKWLAARDGQLVPAAMSNDLTTYDSVVSNVSQPIVDALKGDIDALQGEVKAISDSVNANSDSNFAKAKVILISGLAIALMVVITLALLTTNAITRGVARVKESPRSTGAG
ncbi:MCP four helix bundle domain-containing protein [Cellulomonas sp. P24]|uniref:MCP four helix bundle domain-containing protein n=1 Tax=Cellulomonas sp. P24 TaxID=2885206 RepID=UPI0028708CF7|nr:MCP four helix bundle domain-containing protein [Cellulomonas sp. P24]